MQGREGGWGLVGVDLLGGCEALLRVHLPVTRVECLRENGCFILSS